jgi:hypothetical protein
LPEQYRKFSEFYALYGNAMRAGRYAGYGQTTDNNSTVFRLLTLPAVQEAIAYYRSEYAKAADFTPIKIVQELSAMADVDVSDLFNEDWTLRPKSSLPKALRRAMVGLEVRHTKYGLQIKPKFAKFEALQELAKLWEMSERQGEEQVSPGTSVHINIGQNVQLTKESAPTVQIGPLSILPAEE